MSTPASSETRYETLKDTAPSKDKMAMVRVKIFILIAGALVLLVGLSILVHLFISKLSTTEIIVIISLLVAVGRFTWIQCKRIKKSSTASNKSVALRVESEHGFTTITCKIANKDTRRIKPKYIYLFIEKGMQPKGEEIDVKFPFLLCHQDDNSDCMLGARCKNSPKLTVFPDGIVPKEFMTIECGKRFVISLDELCQTGRHYIDPGEEFAQDVVVKLQEGVYRATVIWTSEGDDDCICATKVFVVFS